MDRNIIIAGKQANLLHTDVSIQAFTARAVERMTLAKIFGWKSAASRLDQRKVDSASSPGRHPSVFELSLIAGQFIFYDNNDSISNQRAKKRFLLFGNSCGSLPDRMDRNTFGTSIFIAKRRRLGHDTVAKGPAGWNLFGPIPVGFTRDSETDFLPFLDGTVRREIVVCSSRPGDIP